ncbi:DUF6303 family protein [Streptomyces sp. L2]|uniref:DUF6303 family protein n=1 Tax=Streptomyces sp. L2 TaxID=2162665 RepID=UPI001011D6F1|nr:DUF6303 family protein [Streptomyces sp. L2]
MPKTFTAHMTASFGRWSTYVVRRDLPAPWPERVIGPVEAERVPSFIDRSRALAALGYELVPGAVWEWAEFRADPGDAASPLRLLGIARVRSRSGVVA